MVRSNKTNAGRGVWVNFQLEETLHTKLGALAKVMQKPMRVVIQEMIERVLEENRGVLMDFFNKMYLPLISAAPSDPAEEGVEEGAEEDKT